MNKKINKSLILKELKAKLNFKSDTDFAKYLGIKPQTLASWYTRNSFDIDLLYAKCVNINPVFLLTGSGNVMLDDDYDYKNTALSSVNESMPSYGFKIPKGAIPYYNLPVSAGKSVLNIDGAISPDGYIKDIPGIGNTEAFLPVHGYSMYPEIKEGAIIGVKKASNYDHLNTQNKYLIVTRDDRMVKYIKHDLVNSDILWCISPNYGDFSILKEEIIEIYRVTVVMNPE